MRRKTIHVCFVLETLETHCNVNQGARATKVNFDRRNSLLCALGKEFALDYFAEKMADQNMAFLDAWRFV